jgi:DNA/RNA-binding domain of Phe-tRNA-synthetase-like protein
MSDNKDIFIINPEVAGAYPGFKIGIVALKNIEQSPSPKQLQDMKAEAEDKIRAEYAGFSREQVNTIPTIAAYNKYYKLFDKTYHVRAQVESIIKGKNLPDISGLFDAMFLAEVKNMILTAGHDLDSLELPIHLSVAAEEENYEGMKGVTRNTYKNDLYMRDGQGIISAIISGPDDRSKITPATTNALFACYAPAEISAIQMTTHLKDMADSIALFSPNLETAMLETFELK